MRITDDTAHIVSPDEARCRLSSLEKVLDLAPPGSLPFEFWNRILEIVEALPAREELAWKAHNLRRLRDAVVSPRNH